MQPLLIEVAIETRSKADQRALDAALAGVSAEDPSFRVSTDHESGQIVVKGTSELHLHAKLEKLQHACAGGLNVGSFQVAFLERPTRRAETEYVHRKVTGSKGEFAAVKIVVEPNDPGKGYRFASKTSDGAVPVKFIAGIEKGVESVLTCGVLAGFPVVDVKVELIDGKYHDVDSSAQAFETASRMALRDALGKAGSVLLEPIMKVEVVTPGDCVGPIIDDFNTRRGQIESRDIRDGAIVVRAKVPLMTMLGYANSLPEMSKGRATFTMQFDHYAPVPTPEDHPPFRPAIGMRA